MNKRIDVLPQQAVRTVETWRLREAEARSRTLDCLFAAFSGAVLDTASPTMGTVILFEEGSFRLDGRARAALRERSAALRANPGIRVVIGGLASPVGSPAYAMGLGLQRVQAIRAFVLSQGIDPARVDVGVRGAGWSLVERPSGATEEGPLGECRIQIADSRWALWRN